MVDQVGDFDALVLIEKIDRGRAGVVPGGTDAVDEPHNVEIRIGRGCGEVGSIQGLEDLCDGGLYMDVVTEHGDSSS